MKTLPQPRTATEALRLAKTFEALATMEMDMYWAGDGTCTAYSWKLDQDGKKVKSRYEIDLNAWSCTCPDFQNRGSYCKHLLRARDVEIAEAEEEFIQNLIDGEAFMQNLHLERSIR